MAFDITAIFVILITFFILIFDLWLFVSNKRTISQLIIQWSEKLLIIPFLWGFLMGHWFA